MSINNIDDLIKKRQETLELMVHYDVELRTQVEDSLKNLLLTIFQTAVPDTTFQVIFNKYYMGRDEAHDDDERREISIPDGAVYLYNLEIYFLNENSDSYKFKRTWETIDNILKTLSEDGVGKSGDFKVYIPYRVTINYQPHNLGGFESISLNYLKELSSMNKEELMLLFKLKT